MSVRSLWVSRFIFVDHCTVNRVYKVPTRRFRGYANSSKLLRNPERSWREDCARFSGVARLKGRWNDRWQSYWQSGKKHSNSSHSTRLRYVAVTTDFEVTWSESRSTCVLPHKHLQTAQNDWGTQHIWQSHELMRCIFAWTGQLSCTRSKQLAEIISISGVSGAEASHKDRLAKTAIPCYINLIISFTVYIYIQYTQ